MIFRNTFTKLQVVLILSLLFAQTRLYGQILDATFVPTYRYISFAGIAYTSAPLVIQPDGKVIINNEPQGIVRLNQDASIDPSWNSATFNASGVPVVSCAALQSDNKVVIGGSFSGGGPAFVGNDWLLRLNSNGTIDPSFANVLADAPIETEIYTIAIQSDNKILVGGRFSTDTPTHKTNLVRLLSNGSVDPSFETDSIGGVVWNTHLLSDGKILIAGDFTWVGNYSCRGGYCRLNPDGTFDTSFETTSIFLPLERAKSFAIQPDGKILITTTMSRIVRLKSDGSTDASYKHGITENTVNSLIVQADGKIIVGGSFSFYSIYGSGINLSTPLHMMRLQSDGTLDTTFGISGRGFDSEVTNLNLLPDGKILAMGYFDKYDNITRSGLARFYPQSISAPSIISFSPASARQGETVTINGTNFTGTTSLLFGGVAAQSFTIVSPTQITAVVGSGSSGSINITNPSGTTSLAGFTFIGTGSGSSSSGNGGVSPGNGTGSVASPTITSVSQTFGELGTKIIIRGTYFSQAQAVRFGNVIAQSFSIDSDTQITATVGNGASGQISVQTAGGTAFWLEAFVYASSAPPVIIDVNPSSIFTGDGNYTLTVIGRNFSPNSKFSIAPQSMPNLVNTISIISINSTNAVLNVPLALRKVDTYKLTVQTADFSSVTTYTVVLGTPPAIQTLSVISTTASSQAFTTVLRGSRFFRQFTTITMNGIPVKSSVISSIQAYVEIPKEVNTFGNENLRIRLEHYDGQYTEATVRINARTAPYITNVRAVWLNNGSTLHLIIEGTGFLRLPRVTLNAQELQVINATATSLEVLVSSDMIIPSLIASAPVLIVENFDFQRYGYRVSPALFQQTVTSISNQPNAPAFTLYPNPTTDILTIEATLPCAAQPVRLILRNALGAAVLTLEAQSADGLLRKELNVAQLASGAYSVELSCGAERLVGRFVRF